MPGSLLTYTMEKSMKSGPRAGLAVSAGHAVLELALVILLFLGIGSFLQAPLVQVIIGVLGGIVLIYFGAGMVKDVLQGKVNVEIRDSSSADNRNIILGSALVSASNPYFLLWWAAVGLSLMMNAYNILGIAGIVLFYTGHILSDFTWYNFVSFVIGKSRRFMNIKIYRAVIIVLGLFLMGFGAGFVVSAVKTAATLFAA